MNDRNKRSSAFLTPSGCLTGDALMLFVSGSLKGKDQLKAQNHIAACPLCSDAADGLRMWMNENESGKEPHELSIEASDYRKSEIPDKHSVTAPENTRKNNRVRNLFHARTDEINHRIRQRLHAHSRIKAAEKKRLSYKPFVWLSAAATIMLFIVIGYVLWLQNQLYAEKLAGERASQMLMLQGPANPDTLTVSIPENKTVLAFQVKKGNEIRKPYQNTAVVIVPDQEVLNPDKPDDALQIAENPLQTAGKETPVASEETKVSRSYRTATMPNGKKALSPEEKIEIEEESSPVFTMVDEMPSYPGGEEARIRFLSGNIKYPQQAAVYGIQGTVYVSFIVKADGTIADGKILRGIGGGCDREALRVVKMMPRWKPGKQDGKLVDVLYTIPIVFRLSN